MLLSCHILSLLSLFSLLIGELLGCLVLSDQSALLSVTKLLAVLHVVIASCEVATAERAMREKLIVIRICS